MNMSKPIPDALVDHRLLVSSIGGEEDSEEEPDLPKTDIILTTDGGEEQTLVEGVFITEEEKATGHLVQLEDGSTVFVPNLISGQSVTLEDGTTAFIHADNKHVGVCETLQAVELEDGTTAYIALTEDDLQQGGLRCKVDRDEDESSSDGETEFLRDKEVTPKERVFKCNHDGCEKSYTSLHHLKVHERKHTGVRPFKCVVDGCGKAFNTSYSLKSHIRVHTGEKPYQCPEQTCSKCFKTSGDLQKHVRTHTGERPFQCPYEGCERSFTTSNIRKVHMRTHTGERPYVCQEPNCGRTFASATNFKNHTRIHSGEKPYVCAIEGCNKRFTEYSSLYKHHIVHSQQKPYFCNVCSRNYRQAYTLTMHKRTAHGIIEGEDGNEIMLDEELAAELFATTTKRKKTNMQPIEIEEVCVQLVEGEEQANGQTTTLVTMQGATAQTIQQVAKAAASCSGQTQIYFVTDPAQLAALQQLGVTSTTNIIISQSKEETDS